MASFTQHYLGKTYCWVQQYFILIALHSMAGIYHTLFIYDALEKHLDFFQFFATMSSAAINIFVHAFFVKYVNIYVGYISNSGIIGS